MIGKWEILWYNNAMKKCVKEWVYMKNLIEEWKIKNLLKEVKEEKKTNPIVVILIIIGVIVLIAAAAYAIYRFFAPDSLDDFEDEFEDEFDDDFYDEDDFFEDDDIVIVDSEEPIFED